MSAEVIEVRLDQRFDEKRLHEWLRGKLEDTEKDLDVRQFGGEHANLRYLLHSAAVRP